MSRGPPLFLRGQYLLHSVAIERQVADTHASRMGNGVGQCTGARTLRRLAGAEEMLAWPVDDVHVHALRDMREAQDRITRPVAARDARVGEHHRLERRPADRLDDAALDLVLDAI